MQHDRSNSVQQPLAGGAVKLSLNQRRVLADVARFTDHPEFNGVTRSCTNSTLSALERRGLVEGETIPTSWGTWLWKVTPAGRAALAQAEGK